MVPILQLHLIFAFSPSNFKMLYLSLVAYCFIYSVICEKAYHISSDYKAATNHYSVLTGNDEFCMSKCDDDTLCNGYSINISNNTCFLSRCDLFTDVPECSTCYFASKKVPSSSILCSSTTDQPAITTSMSTTLLSTTMPHTTTLTESITLLSTTMSHTTILTESTTFPATTAGMHPTTESNPSTILTMDGTTQNIIVNSTLCFCVCKITNRTLKESVESRRKDLTVNKTQISYFIRKLTSAQDDRKMSEVIGIGAIIFLVFFALFLCCADICVTS